MRRCLLLLLVVLAAVLAAGCAGEPAGPARWIVANVHPPDYPTARALSSLAEAAAADPVLGPALSLDLQLGGALGNEKEVLEKLRFGGIQGAVTSVAPLAEFVPAVGVLTLPYLFRDEEQFWEVLEGPVGEELLAELEAEGLVGLAWYDAGARSFYNGVRPVRRPADLAGLKIRVQRSEIMRETVAALGATPVAIGFKDVYTNLYTGAIDGAENNLPSYRSERHFEVAKFYSLDRHSMIPDLLLVARAAWERLGEEERRALRAAAEESSRVQRRLWAEYRAAALAEVEAAGCEVAEVEGVEAWRAAVEPVYGRFAGRWGGMVERIRGR